MANIEKNNKIREKGRETRIRRKSQEARVFEIKFDANKISNQKLNSIKRAFLEGKWFTNYIIAKGVTESVPYKDYNVKKVNIKVNDAPEERELNVLSSQMKEYMIKRLQNNIKALTKLKKEGKRVGKIKYIKSLHSIPLMQYGITYKIDMERKRVHIQGLGDFKAVGLDQIPGNYEFATANLIERNGDYFLHVVAYAAKSEKAQNDKAVGIDLGIKNQVTFSNGIQVQYAVPMQERTKRLYHAFSRSKYDKEKKTRSKRGLKLLYKINREFAHQNNQKRDINNKLAHYVTCNYQYVAYQNDNIASWATFYGKKIYQTSIGEFRNVLKRKACTPLEIGRFERTTGICPNCGRSLHLDLSDRAFVCPSCGCLYDRDVSAANMIRKLGLSLWNIGETLAEGNASTSSMLVYIKHIPHVKASISVEARSPKLTDVAEVPSVRAG